MPEERRQQKDREHILREVYEDNVRIRDRQPRGNAYSAHPYVTGVSGMFVLALVVMFAANYVFSDAAPISNGTGNSGSLSGARPVLGAPILEPLSDDDDNLPAASEYIRIGDGASSLAELFDLQVRTIVIDPGHGGSDPGASGYSGSREKDITLDVALRLRDRLRSGYGFNVLMTRERDETVTLRERAEFSNGHEADLYISVHVNSFPDERVVALETYYFGPGDPQTDARLAERENTNSDYSVAEFNRMMQHMGDRIKLQESRRVARFIQRSLYANAQQVNEDVSNWGVKTAPFVVLVGAEAPAILSEIGVISNPEAETRLMTPEYREQVAMFLEEGIVNYLGDLSRHQESTHPTNAAEEEE